LGAAAERSDRALAHFIGAQRGYKRQAAALHLRAGARRGTWRSGWPGAGAGAAGTTRTRRLLVFGFRREARRWALNLAKPLLRDVIGLALGFLFALMALLFVALAGFRCLALDAIGRLAAGAALRFFFCDPTLLRVTNARVGKRMRARTAFFFGEGAQHNA
jgi:hypothetical protein